MDDMYVCEIDSYSLSSICQEMVLVLQHYLKLPLRGSCESYI